MSSTGLSDPEHQRRLAHLDALAGIGVELARSLHRTVLGAEAAQNHAAEMDPTCTLFPPADVVAVAAAFNRIARAVRMTVALHARLDRATRRGVTPDHAAAGPAAAPRSRSTSALGAHTDRREHLFDHEDGGDLSDRPVGEIVALICRDLRLDPARTTRVTAAFAIALDEPGPCDDGALEAGQRHDQAPRKDIAGLVGPGVDDGPVARAGAP
jgi:hypothetical protein